MSLLAGRTLLAVDTETTGMSPASGDRLVEVAYVPIVDGVLGEGWSSLVRPGRAIPPGATNVHKITDAMVAGAPTYAEVARALREACADLPLVFHNAPFDLPFLVAMFEEAGLPPLRNAIVDTLGIARERGGVGGNSLGALATREQLPVEPAHRALGDARTTARLFLKLAAGWKPRREAGDDTPASLAELAANSQDVMRTTGRR